MPNHRVRRTLLVRGAASLLLCLSALAASADTINYFDQGRSLFAAHDYRQAADAFSQVPATDPAYAWSQLYFKACRQRLQEGLGPEGAAVLDREALKRRLQTLAQEQRDAQRFRKEHNRLTRQMEETSEAREERERTAWERQQEREAKLRVRAQRLAQAIAPMMPHPAATSVPSPTTAAQQITTPAGEPIVPVPQGPPISIFTPLTTTPPPTITAPAAPPETRVAPTPLPVTPTGVPAIWPPPRPELSKPGAISVQADSVQYDSERKRVIATGHVVVDYGSDRLTCERAIVYSESKEAYAEGNAKLTQEKETLVGELLHYDLVTRHGQVLMGDGYTFPWYFKGPQMQQISAHHVRMLQGYATTCEFDPPHYRFQAKQADVFLDDQIVMRRGVFYFDTLPVFYYPRWTYSLKENQTKVQLIPGKHKQWGPFLLSKWRYELNRNAKGLFHLDWRNNFGWAEGLDLKYRSDDWGDGIMRTYYQESTDRMDPKTKPSRFNRHWVEWRHRWQFDQETQATVQFEKFSDAEFRKQFLFRERYDEETTENSFVSVIRNRSGYTLSGIVTKRVNRFDSVTEELPSLKLNINDAPIGDTPLFYQGRISYEQLNIKAASPSDSHNDVVRIDTFNQLSYAAKLAFINLTPRVGMQQTYFNKDNKPNLDRRNRNVIRGALSAGGDVSTRFFRIFDVRTNVLGLDINMLRHVINPTVNYNVAFKPTIPSLRLSPFDSVSREQRFTFTLENKLQTKRKKVGQVSKATDLVKSPENWSVTYPQEETVVGERRAGNASTTAVPVAQTRTRQRLQNVDLARLLLSMPYDVHPKSGPGSRFGNLMVDLEVLPYSWMRVESDATYDTHATKAVDHRFLSWNMDVVLSPNDRWYLGAGHRYSRNDKAELTTETGWRLGKKWTLRGYWRYTFKEVAGRLKRFDNLRETQYVITRDLHDWFLDIIYHVDREFGEELYFVLRWKAFPEVPFQTKVSYHQPKFGSQSSPFSPIAGEGP